MDTNVPRGELEAQPQSNPLNIPPSSCLKPHVGYDSPLGLHYQYMRLRRSWCTCRTCTDAV